MMMSAGTTTPAWSDPAIAQLQQRQACPVCGAAPLTDAVCRRCGADLASPAALALWEASQAAVAALQTREALRRAIPRAPVSSAHAAGTPSPEAPRTRRPASRPAPAPRRHDTTLQSVLAVAGAGLFAVAAIVFTFFSPELSDATLRGAATLAATVILMAGARALSVRGLRSSAETTAALALVFAALDVYSFATIVTVPSGPWAPAGFGTLITGATLLALARRWSLRAWVGAPAAALATVPAMLGAPAGSLASGLAGWLTSMAAGAALIVVIRHRARFARVPLRAEIVALTLVQLAAAAAAMLSVATAADGSAPSLLWAAAVAAVTIGIVARCSAGHAAAALWSFGAGGAFSAAGLASAQAVVEVGGGGPGWYPVAWIVGPLAGFLVATLVLPEHGRAQTMWTNAGSLVVTGVGSLPVAALAAYGALRTLTARPAVTLDDLLAAAGAAGALWAGAGLLAVHAAGMRRRGRTAWASVLAAWTTVAAAAATTTIPYPGRGAATVAGLIVAGALALALLRALTLRASVAVPLSIAAHTALALGAALSWRDTSLAASAAPFVVGVLLVLAARRPAGGQWAHLGVAFAYALAGAGAALTLTSIGPIGTVSIVTSAAGIGAMLATFSSRISSRTWWALLTVTAVPFAFGILQVVRERSGWTALSTAVIFLLALTLTATRRPGLSIVLRGLSAAVLVPSLAVVVICLGAQILSTSASPVTLPTIAAIVAVALAIPDAGRSLLESRGVPPREAQFAAWTFEVAAIVTAVVAVALSLTRTAAGLHTAALVLATLAVGAVAAALITGAARAWWYAAAAATGAWVVCLQIVGVDVVEVYVAPPAVSAVAVGAVLVRRGRPGRALVWTGLISAAAASLVALAAFGDPLRFAFLLIASAVLLVTGGRFPSSSRWSRTLRAALLVSSMLAAAAGPVWGVRAVMLETAPPPPGAFWSTLGCAAAGASLALIAGVALARTSSGAASPGRSGAGAVPSSRAQWSLAPALLWLTAGTWPAVHRDWATIWGMWSLMLVLCIGVVAIAWRRRRDDGILPPVWFVFALAFVTAVVAWSPRDLRVEWFSLPLGAALLAAGALQLRVDGQEPPGPRMSITAWPRSARGSWPLLAPGLVVLFSASTAATFTDPLTWRAVLVMVMALVAILLGARLRLAAPFVLGIVVLPIENVLAFAVQIGRGIDSMPWWITLAAVGTVLLILGVSYERRAGDAEGFAARLRDLA